MPSPRRIRLLFYVVLAGFVTLLFFTSHFRQAQEPDTRTVQDFYHKTMNAMDRGHRGSRGSQGGGGSQQQQQKPIEKQYGDGDEEVAKAMAERLRLAEQKAKDSANAKAPNRPDAPEDVIGVGSSAGGQLKKGKDDKEELPRDSEEDVEVKTEINTILKKSPIIIFSKSYCPYSKRAKSILLDKYHIEPAPYVVELDEHPLGAKIQERLGQMTSRTTVPNVMINGISIGGGDDVAALDRDGELSDKIKELGGKRMEVTKRPVSKAG